MPIPTTPSGRARVPGGQPGDRISGRASVPSPDSPRSTPGGSSGGRDGGRGRDGAGGRDGGTGYRGRQYSGKRRPRWGRIALVSVLALALLVLLGGFGVYLYAHSLDSKVTRFDAFGKINTNRPAVVTPGATNILLLGSDSRNPDTTLRSRTDTIILMHIQADHKHAYLISIPRDTLVFIPKSPTNPGFGNTMDKINSAYSWGGAALTVEAVEGFTGVHIDHVAIIDFAGFQQVTDALGGVNMYVDQTIKSIHKPYRTFTKGNQHFTGAEALDYVRQRYQFAGGDITRGKHQQEFLKAVMDKAASSGTLTNPFRLNAFLQAVTKAMSVDNTFSLTGMAWQYHGLRSRDLTFMTSPFSGFGNSNGESVVLSDKAKASALYDAVAKDTVAQWVAGNKGG